MIHSLKKLCGAGALLLPLSVWAQDNGSLYNDANTQQQTASGNLALFNQLQDQQSTINDLRGQIEDLQHQVQQLSDDGSKRYEDLDTRLSALENNGADKNDQDNGQNADDGDGSTSTSADADKGAGAAAGTGAAAGGSDSSASADSQAYNKAFGLIQAKKYPDAINALKEFNQHYPKSPLKANSYYWLGQLYNNQSNMQGASHAFAAVLSEFPKSNKAPDAAYSLAMIKARQGDDTGAQKLLNTLVKQHPKTDAGKKASAFLKKVNG